MKSAEVTETPTEIFENSTRVGLTIAMAVVYVLAFTVVIVHAILTKQWTDVGVAAILGVITLSGLTAVIVSQPLELLVTPNFIGVRRPWQQPDWIAKESIEVRLYPGRGGTQALFKVARGQPFGGPRRFGLTLSWLTEKSRGSDVTPEDISRLGIKVERHTSPLWRLFY